MYDDLHEVRAPHDEHANRRDAGEGPRDWTTGDEPAALQRSYLETLATESGTEVPDELTKAEASKLIDELRDKSPRVDS